MKSSHDVSLSDNRVLRKLNIIKQCKPWLRVNPVFVNFKYTKENEAIVLEFLNEKSKNVFFNIPCLADGNINGLKILADNQEMRMFNPFTINNQYGKCDIYQTHVSSAKVWKVIINI